MQSFQKNDLFWEQQITYLGIVLTTGQDTLSLRAVKHVKPKNVVSSAVMNIRWLLCKMKFPFTNLEEKKEVKEPYRRLIINIESTKMSSTCPYQFLSSA